MASDRLSITVGLLEVVTEDLLLLLEPVGMVLEPACEPFVKLAPLTLRERVIGRIADQEVTEPERVLSAENWAIGTQELLAYEPREPRGHLRVSRSESLNCPSMEHAALHGAGLEHRAFLVGKLVETRREQRLNRRRHRDVAVRLLAHE